MGYINDYKWSILRHTTRPEEIGSVTESITANGRWRYQQVGWDEIQPIIKLLPADSHGLAKLLPKLHTNYDAWYFDSSALKDGITQRPQTQQELKVYCETTTIYGYTLALFDQEQGYLWYFKLN